MIPNEPLVDLPLDIKQSLPLERSIIDGLTEIAGGGIQSSYLALPFGVIHIARPYPQMTVEQAEVCNRWVYPNKGMALASVQNHIPQHNGIVIPRITLVSESIYEGENYPVWLDEFIPGETLLQMTFKGIGFNEYARIVEWLAMFHSHLNENSYPLIDYYSQRLNAIAGCFTDEHMINLIGADSVDKILTLTEEKLRELPLALASTDRAHVIHGDFRAENILINGSQIGVIDFEQGINGGDPFIDLEKLLMFSHPDQPDPAKPFTYRVPLTTEQKRELVKYYISICGVTASPVVDQLVTGQSNSNALKARMELIDFDNLVSSLVHNFVKGWHFDQMQGRNFIRKGALNTLAKMRRKYGW